MPPTDRFPPWRSTALVLLGVASCAGPSPTFTSRSQAVSTDGTLIKVLGSGGSGTVYSVEVNGQTVAVKVPADASEAGLQAAQASITPPEFGGPPPTSVSGYVTFTLENGQQVTGVPMPLIDGVTLKVANTELEFCQAFQVAMNNGLSSDSVSALAATFQQMQANGLAFGDLNNTNLMVSGGKPIVIDNPVLNLADLAATEGPDVAAQAASNFAALYPQVIDKMNQIVAFQASMQSPLDGTTTPGEVTATGDVVSATTVSLSADGIDVGISTAVDGSAVVSATNTLAIDAKVITVTASATDVASGIFDLTGTVLDVTSTALEAAITTAGPIVAQVQTWLAVLEVTLGMPLDAPTMVPLGNGNVTTPPQAPTAGEHGHYYVDRMADGSFVITDQQSGNAMGYLKVSDGSYTAFKADLDVQSGNYTFRTSDGFVGTTDHRGVVLATYANPNNDHFTVISIDGRASGGGSGGGPPPGGTCNRPAGNTCEDCAGPPETQDKDCDPNEEIVLGDLSALQAENCQLVPSVTTVANAANAQQIPTTIRFTRSGIAAGTFMWEANGRTPFHQPELDAMSPVTDAFFDANYLGVAAGSYKVHTLLTLANGQMIPCGDSTITVVDPSGGGGGGGGTCSIGSRLGAGDYPAVTAALDDYYCAYNGGAYCTSAVQAASAAGVSTVATGTCANGDSYKQTAALDEYYCRYYEYLGYDTAANPDYAGYCAAANTQASLGACTGCGGGGGGGTCVPTTCAAHGQTCGTLDDGCGHVLTCGSSCLPSLAITSATNIGGDATTVTGQLVGTFSGASNAVNLSCTAGGYTSVFNVSVTYNSASLIDFIYPRVYGPGSSYVCQVRVNVGASSSAYVTLNGFADMADSDPTAPFAYEVFGLGIMPACVPSPVSFCPSYGVTREDAAAYVIRAVYGDNFAYTATPYFDDVPYWDPDFKYVQKMRDLGITSGCGPRTFCAGALATRGDVSVFVVRANQAKNGRAVDAFGYPSTPYFSDVQATDYRFPYVQAMRAANVTSGCTSATFCVGDNVSRSQLATFVVRALVDSLSLPAP